MFTKLIAAVSLIALGAGLAPGQAQAQTRGPAEIPPASYTASQYVDSRGCIYVRAGAAGNVTWIPRMDRGRSHMCGARPTTGVARVDPPVSTAPIRAASAATIVPSTAPRMTRTISPTIPVTTGFQTTSAATVPLVPTIPSTARSAAPASYGTRSTAPAAQVASACPGASRLSRQYINHGQHGPVRCGPQPVHPMDVYRPQGARPTTTSPGAITYAFGANPPLERVNASPQTPAGYRVAWTDGRLNPNRGVPGATAAATSPYQATLSTRSAPAAQQARAPRATATAPAGRVAVSVGVGHRYVQVGTYGQPQNAQNALRRLQGLGLPVGISRTTLRGQPVEVVLAGPFADATQLGSALYRARQAGFTDATTRR